MEVALGSFEDERFEVNQGDIDPLKPASTALEYLRQVQKEASLCPDVVVASGYKEKLKKKSAENQVQIKTVLTPAPKEYLPSVDWQNEQASRFAELRQTLNHHKSLNKPSQNSKENSLLPNVSCQDHWCRFCLGERALQDVKRRRGQQSNKRSTQENDCENEENREIDEGNDPLLSIMTRLGQCAVIDVLEYHVTWLQQLGFSPRQGKWLYALLACLEKPLLPNVASLLRNLARRCADLRASLPDKDDERLAPLNLIIAIVTRYFDQTDLADEC